MFAARSCSPCVCLRGSYAPKLLAQNKPVEVHEARAQAHTDVDPKLTTRRGGAGPLKLKPA
eukprot:4527859-Alexandrium_andersonii.AAC.1